MGTEKLPSWIIDRIRRPNTPEEDGAMEDYVNRGGTIGDALKRKKPKDSDDSET